MGRKVKERAYEEDGAVKHMPSNSEVAKYTKAILAKREKLKTLSAEIRSDIRDTYDAASNAGIDRRILKQTVSLIEKMPSYEDRSMVNLYLEKNGQYAFFNLENAELEKDEEAA